MAPRDLLYKVSEVDCDRQVTCQRGRVDESICEEEEVLKTSERISTYQILEGVALRHPQFASGT